MTRNNVNPLILSFTQPLSAMTATATDATLMTTWSQPKAYAITGMRMTWSVQNDTNYPCLAFVVLGRDTPTYPIPAFNSTGLLTDVLLTHACFGLPTGGGAGGPAKDSRTTVQQYPPLSGITVGPGQPLSVYGWSYDFPYSPSTRVMSLTLTVDTYLIKQ